jgi:RNA polymerase sigma-70 factor (ECF subfamily)
MRLDAETRTAMLTTIPHLRAFAVLLCGDVNHADDLVHATLVRAIAHIDEFQPGSNLRAWLFTLLRHVLHSGDRRGAWERAHRKFVAPSAVLPGQTGRDTAGDLHEALGRLSLHQREALVLIAGAELSYEEAAVVADCDVEAMKIQVHEAAVRLAMFMSHDRAWRPMRSAS